MSAASNLLTGELSRLQIKDGEVGDKIDVFGDKNEVKKCTILLDKYMYPVIIFKIEVKQLLEVFCTHLYFDNVKFEPLGSGQ